jgi:hypothetical protein
MNDSRKISRSNGGVPAMNTYEYACKCAQDMYAHFPNSITIEATVAAAAATDQLTFDDFCGLMIDLNVGQGANTLKMDVRGAVSGDSVRNFLSSHAGRIKLINYTCREDADQLTNKIKLVSASIDENTAVHKIFDVATDIRNTQFQETLQTVYPHKGDAWLTKNSGIVLATSSLPASTKTVSLTIQFDCFLPYAMICG